MINNDTAAPRPSDLDEPDTGAYLRPEEMVAKIIAEAYDPDNCEQCEAVGSTCWECAQDCF